MNVATRRGAPNRAAAVIGLGSMGFGMARSLLRAGLPGDRLRRVAREAVERLVAEAGPAGTDAGRGRARRRRRRLASSSTPPRPRRSCSARRARPRRWRRARSSSPPRPWTRRRPPLAARLEATGRLYLDAPISGGAARAAKGELTILASGRAAAFATARPALDAMAAKLYELGDEAGVGAAFKMINQLLAGVHIAAACEAMALRRQAGARPAKVYEVITASAGNSWMFENRVPHILAGDYRRTAPSTSSSRTWASSRTWRARSVSRCRSRRRPCRCISRPRGPAWAGTTTPRSRALYAALSGTALLDAWRTPRRSRTCRHSPPTSA